MVRCPTVRKFSERIEMIEACACSWLSGTAGEKSEGGRAGVKGEGGTEAIYSVGERQEQAYYLPPLSQLPLHGSWAEAGGQP